MKKSAAGWLTLLGLIAVFMLAPLLAEATPISGLYYYGVRNSPGWASLGYSSDFYCPSCTTSDSFNNHPPLDSVPVGADVSGFHAVTAVSRDAGTGYPSFPGPISAAGTFDLQSRLTTPASGRPGLQQ